MHPGDIPEDGQAPSLCPPPPSEQHSAGHVPAGSGGKLRAPPDPPPQHVHVGRSECQRAREVGAERPAHYGPGMPRSFDLVMDAERER